MLAVDPDVQAQVERILDSAVLRSSEGLRRLLRFLADKSLSGDAEQLKEYTIGVDAFGKPPTYDPQQDSYVRIQVGRLRQKLAEYYQAEGRDDSIIIDLPKGRYKLNWQMRPQVATLIPAPIFAAEDPSRGWKRPVPIVLCMSIVALFIVSGWATFATVQLTRERQESKLFREAWTPELAALWQPFLTTERPLLVSIEAPVFVTLPGIGYFRDTSVNRTEDIPKSRTIRTVQNALQAPAIVPQTYYTPFGEVSVILQLGKLLAARKTNISVIKGSDLSWQQLSENNVLFMGSEKFYNSQLASLPVRQELTLDADGIHNLYPRDGEPTIYADEASRTGDRILYALISHTPGPLGKGDVESFASSISAGRIAAAESFIEPASARTLLGKMKRPSGGMPRYYQLILKVRSQAGVPIETSYVLHRELHLIQTK